MRDVFESGSVLSGFILSISQTNALKVLSQKSSHADKTNDSILHTHIYLERCLHILLCLPGTPTVFLSFLKENFPKAEELKDSTPSPTTSSSTPIPQILPLQKEKLLKTGAENSIRRNKQIQDIEGLKVKKSIDNFCINHRF